MFSTKFSLFLLAALAPVVASFAQESKSNIDFIANKSQWPAHVAYRANAGEGAVFFTAEGFTYNFYSGKDAYDLHELRHKKKDVRNEPLHWHAYQVRFTGANKTPAISPAEKRTNHYNFFKGNDPAKWSGMVPAYSGIQYAELYRGIDLKVYSKGSAIEYDFIVQPGSRVSDIRMKFTGVKPALMPDGNLRITTSINEVTEQVPVAFQVVGGVRKDVPVKYALSKDGTVSFIFPKDYDHTLELVIDPVLVFSTYSGATGNTYGYSATYDKAGNLYAGGECFDTEWPVTTGAYQTTFGGSVDAGVNKYNATGTTLMYSTYFGGSGSDVPSNMVTNPAGELIVCGSTSFSDLPVTPGCYDPTFNGEADLYVVRFNNTGSALLGATFLGGTSIDGFNNSSLSPNYGDENRGEVLTDAAGNIFIAGSTSSSDFPVTPGAYQTTIGGQQDGCVAKLTPDCSSLLFSTFLGGSDMDACFSIVASAQGNLAVCGGTMSADFPTTPGTLHSTFLGETDGFVSILNANGSVLEHSSFLGTPLYDHGFKIQVDMDDNILVCGQTVGSYPVTPGVYTNANSGIFIDKLSPDLSTSIQSTLIGQDLGEELGPNLIPTAFLSDVCGNIYFCGFEAIGDLPLTPDANQTTPGGFWLCVLRLNMSTLFYATYMGAPGDHVDGGTSRFDPDGIVYHSVCNYTDFPTTAGSYQPTDVSGMYDVASFKFDFEMNGVRAGIGLGGSDAQGCTPFTVSLENLSVNAATYLWDFNDGTPAVTTATPPAHTFTTPGVYNVMLVAYNDDISFCNNSDTAYLTITVSDPNLEFLNSDTVLCLGVGPVVVSAPGTNYPGSFVYQWLPDPSITSPLNQESVTVNVTQPTTLYVIVSNGSTACNATDTAVIQLNPSAIGQVSATGDTTICAGDTVRLSAEGGNVYLWSPAAGLENAHASETRAWPALTTVYTVRISDAQGCSDTQQVTVSVRERVTADAGPGDIIRYGESTKLHASGGGIYLWTPSNTLSSATDPQATAFPLQTTTYYLTVTNGQGSCPVRDSVTIGVTNAALPSAFTPNGDRRNDIFRVVLMNPLVSLDYFRIFDRYGYEVFATKNAAIGWDGVYNGKPAEIGTYFYMLGYKIGDQEYQEKGDLTLIR